MTLLAAGAVAIMLACVIGVAVKFPAGAAVGWVLVLEAMPEFWLPGGAGAHEAIIGAEKAAGILLALILAIRAGARADRYNPVFAYLWMFFAGVAHGLFPGLSLLESFRSLTGSVAPFLFGFARLPEKFCRVVIRAVTLAPFWSVACGAALQAAGLHAMFDATGGTPRLTGPGEAPFLAGFALVAIYAGLVEVLERPGRREFFVLLGNFVILLATGARAPLALAVLVGVAAFMLPNAKIPAGAKVSLLAGTGIMAGLAFIFAGSLGFLRVVDLAQAGQATNLSNRGLTWPYFQAAIHNSPLLGWGVGAGKSVIPVDSPLSGLIGTNAAHNEYLRIGAEGGFFGLALLAALMGLWAWRGSAPLPAPQRWLMRVIFLAFALHSWTDNTLIATTSSVLFLWVSVVFATPRQRATARA
jgi:O-antigen ligase